MNALTKRKTTVQITRIVTLVMEKQIVSASKDTKTLPEDVKVIEGN